MVVGCGGWLESKRSDQLWLSFSLALAKSNNCPSCHEVLLGGDVGDGDDVLLQLDLAVLLGSSLP